MIPDYVYKDLLKTAKDPLVIKKIKNAIKMSKEFRKQRSKLVGNSNGKCERFTYTMGNKTEGLPGVLVRSDMEPPVPDREVNESHEWSGVVLDFYTVVLGLNSLDNQGVDIVSSCHYDKDYDNAFWNGEQMVYGDGDLFLPLTRDLTVAAHEMGHGRIQNTANLVYWFEPGALNEHFADVFGVVTKQWHSNQNIDSASWLVGEDIVSPKFPGKAIRSFKNEKAYDGDPQPKHQKDRNWFMFEDNFGVHVLSGIPNRAFYEFCKILSNTGKCYHSWEAPLTIWYNTLLRLGRFSMFSDLKKISLEEASSLGLERELTIAFQIVGL